MKNYFGFIDETGLLTSDPKQRFFAVGLLKIEDTANFYNQLSKHYYKIISRIEAKRKNFIKNTPDPVEKAKMIHLVNDNKRFEFKFNSIDEISLADYLELANIYFQFPNLHFCALVIDTESPYFDFKKYFTSSWDAYIGYSKMLVRNNCSISEKIAVIADYVQMAHGSIKYFEREMNFMQNIFNTCRVESDASLFIQMVDVLLGAVVYDFKIKVGIIGKEDPNFPKTRLLVEIRKYLNRKSLAEKFTEHTPNYFSVWPFQNIPKAN
jgi:hypothetical protein